jgi:hypothetical protein
MKKEVAAADLHFSMFWKKFLKKGDYRLGHVPRTP